VTTDGRYVRQDEKLANERSSGERVGLVCCIPGVDVASRGSLNIYRRSPCLYAVLPRLNLNTFPYLSARAFPLVLAEQRFLSRLAKKLFIER